MKYKLVCVEAKTGGDINLPRMLQLLSFGFEALLDFCFFKVIFITTLSTASLFSIAFERSCKACFIIGI